jgi:sulfite exporter TauE/SafE
MLGLLPCGLVYAMLAVAVTLPSPLWSALGMATFGLGTVPALSAVVLASRALPRRLRAASPRLVAVGLILVGLFATWRAARVEDTAPHAAHAAVHRPR